MVEDYITGDYTNDTSSADLIVYQTLTVQTRNYLKSPI